MKKSNYTKPLAEVIETSTEDIIRTSLQDNVDGTKTIGGTSSTYDDNYNRTAGGLIVVD